MMFKSLVCFFVFVACVKIKGLLGVKTSFQIIPSVVKRGGYATLRCYYELQGAPLYTVKWYRGTHEIYRFAPADTPRKKGFEIPGIHVDLSLSNETQVMLRELEFNMSGNYSCEVSADAPSFSTSTKTGHLEVVAPPKSGPVIYVDRPSYNPGDVLKANCTASPSRPALNLTLFVNNEVMTGAIKVFQNLEGGFQRSIAMISLQLSHFNFKGGKIVLMCIAQLHPVYLDRALLSLPSGSDPKSERIMSFSGESTTLSTNEAKIMMILLFFLLYLANFVTSLDYDEILRTDYDKVIIDYDNDGILYENIDSKLISALT